MTRPFSIVELDHVVLRCREIDRALDFYVHVLGLHEERRIDAIGLIQLRAGRSMVDLIPAPSEAARVDAALNVDHVCLGIDVADLSQAVSFLKASGVEVIGEPAHRYGARGMGMSIYIRDPEGNVIELKQMPAGA